MFIAAWAFEVQEKGGRRVSKLITKKFLCCQPEYQYTKSFGQFVVSLEPLISDEAGPLEKQRSWILGAAGVALEE